jgi:hypothetical protein
MGAFLVLIRCHVVLSFYWIRLQDWMSARQKRRHYQPLHFAQWVNAYLSLLA